MSGLICMLTCDKNPKNLIFLLPLLLLVTTGGMAQQSTRVGDALVAKLKTPDHRIRDVAYSHDGKLIAASYGFSDEGGVTIWNIADRTVVVNLLFGTKAATSVPCVAFSEDGKLFAAATYNGDVIVWTVGQWRSPRTVLRGRKSPRDVTFGGNMLGFASDDEALLYNLTTGEVTVLATKGEPADSYNEISFTQDGKLVAVIGRRKSFLWSLETRQRVEMLDVKSYGFFGTLSGSGSHFIFGGGPVFGKKSVQIWNVNEKKLVSEITELRDGVFSGAISHSEKLFALAGGTYSDDGGQVSLWSVDDAREIAYTTFGDSPIQGLGFSPDDEMLAAGSEDGYLLLYAVDRLKGAQVKPQTSLLCGEIVVEGTRTFIRSLSKVPLPMSDSFRYPWKLEIINSEAVAANIGAPVVLNEWFIESSAGEDRARVKGFRSLREDDPLATSDHIVIGYTQNPGWPDGFVIKIYSDGRFVAANTPGKCLSYGSLTDLKTNFTSVRDRLVANGLIEIGKDPLVLGTDHYGTSFIELKINGVAELRSDADDISVLLKGGPAKKREAFSRVFKQERKFIDSILKAGLKLPRASGN